MSEFQQKLFTIDLFNLHHMKAQSNICTQSLNIDSRNTAPYRETSRATGPCHFLDEFQLRITRLKLHEKSR